MDLEYSDALVLAPLEEEFGALVNAFSSAGWDVQEETASGTGFVVFLASKRGWEDTNSVKSCRIVKLPDQNILNAASSTAKCFEKLDASIVISFGIAGKIDKELKLGDVVIGSRIIYYDPAKEKDGIIQSRFDPYIPKLPGQTVLKKLNAHEYSVAVGPIASGSRLVADGDSETVERLGKFTDKILCVEMEAAGVASACTQLRSCHKYFAIKGLSDSADKTKGGPSDATYRQIAAQNAARCLAELLGYLRIDYGDRYILSDVVQQKHIQAVKDLGKMREALDRLEIQVDHIELYRCLYDLSAPIPMHFHWIQENEYLHWIDFKLILMLNSLPKDLVKLIPNVSHGNDRIGTMWARTVKDVVGREPVRVDNMNLRNDPFATELFHRFSFANIYSQTGLKETAGVDKYIQQEIITNVAASSNQNRLIVCSWKQSIKRWMTLIPIVGYKYASFSWPDYLLDNKYGKSHLPGSKIFMDAPDFKGLERWCEKHPHLVAEFAGHFAFLAKDLKDNATTERLIGVLRSAVEQEKLAAH